MKRIVLLLFLGWGLCLAGPALAEQDSDSHLRRPGLPGVGPGSDYFHRLPVVGVEIRGTLNTRNMPPLRRPFPGHYFDYLLTGLDGTIQVGNRLYQVDFGSEPRLRELARRLDGRRVLLTGRLQAHSFPRYPMPVLPPAQPESDTVEYIVVTGLTIVDEYVRETVHVEVQGRLDVNYRGDVVEALIRTKDRTFTLDFGSNDQLRQMVRHLHGRTVRLTGALRRIDPRELPHERIALLRFQTILVSTLQVVDTDYIKHAGSVEAQGQLAFYRHIRFGRGAVAVRVAGQDYWLDFGGHDGLYALAQKAGGDHRAVVVTGTLRDSDHAIVVTGLRIAATVESYKETVAVEIKGMLSPRLMILELAIWPPRTVETWEITANGRTFVLDLAGSKDLERLARQVQGKTVILHGTLQGDSVRVTGMYLHEPLLEFAVPCHEVARR